MQTSLCLFLCLLLYQHMHK